MNIFLDTNAFMHIARFAEADRELIAETLTCPEPCDCCGSSGPTFKDSETQCAYCLTCLELSTEPMEDDGEEDAEIVAIGLRILYPNEGRD